jgi:carbon-monoxide dehydrogenase catalytic subunit
MENEPKPQLIREPLDVCELDRVRMSLLNPALIDEKKEERTIDENVQLVLVETSQ